MITYLLGHTDADVRAHVCVSALNGIEEEECQDLSEDESGKKHNVASIERRDDE